jgi:hypothetical protein
MGVHTTEGGVASEPPAAMKSLTVGIATMMLRMWMSLSRRSAMKCPDTLLSGYVGFEFIDVKTLLHLELMLV